MSAYNYIQTFRIDPNLVADSPEVMITSVEVYFKSKPNEIKNTSGLNGPGISVWLCEVENEEPVPEKILTNSLKSISYDMIPTSDKADTACVVGFGSPAVAKPGSTYGIVIKFEDPAFEIWENVQGQVLVNSSGSNLSLGSQGRFGGRLFRANDSGSHKAYNDRDLKFKVNVAQFVSNNITIPLVNKDYEFFTTDNTSVGSFVGGEYVYQNVSNATGTISVTSTSKNVVGTGTTFTSYNVGDKIVVSNGTVRNVLSISNIANATFLTTDKLPSFTSASATFKVPPIGTVYYNSQTKNKLYLVDSTANATVKFVAGTRITGERSGATANVFSIDRYSVDNFTPKFLVGNPTTSNFTLNYRIANSSNALNSTASNLKLLENNMPSYDAYILSRSTEVDTSKSTNLYGDSRKSAVANLSITVTVDQDKRFAVPYIKTNELDFYFYQNDINSTYRATRSIDGVSITNYDTETGKNGLARSKYISKKISFAKDRYAEDVVAYVTAYRPANTEIRVYAKIHNSADKEPFDDKAWTPLELKDNVDKFSTSDPNDMYEYTYGFPQYPEIDSQLSGAFITTSGSNTITTSTDQSSIIKAGDLIKIGDPLIDVNHEVFPVASCNTTAITLYNTINNVNIIGDVKVEKLRYRNVAWNNIANDNVARYVNSSKVIFDTYSSMQIKVVLLSNTTYNVPRVEQIQMIGTSA